MVNNEQTSSSRHAKVAQAKRAAQARVDAGRRRALVGWALVAIVGVGLFAALIAFIVRQDAVGEVSGEGQLTPTVASENGGFGVGRTGVVGQDLDPARVRVDVYVDFICPACGRFEGTQSATLAALREQGIIDVYYHPLAFFDDFSQGTSFSTRASSAAALVAEEAPESFVAFVEAMFANQPAEYTTGLTDGEIQAIAASAGVPHEVVDRFPLHEYSSWTRTATEAASAGGVVQTPTVVVDGDIQDPQANPEDLNWGVEGALEAFLREVAAAT